jgi:mannosyltransferase
VTAKVATSSVAAERPPDDESTTVPARWSRREGTWVALLTAFVLVAGGWQLGHASLSGDEASTWAISAHGLGDVLHALGGSGGDRGAALYYLTIHFWMQLFGTSEVALRSFSLLAAALAITPFHTIARRLGLARAVTAEILLVTSPFFLTYARDARAYALLVLLVVLATWAFIRAVESDSRRDWVQYAAIATLALYTHWFAALVIAVQFLWWLGTKPDREHRRRTLTAAGWLALAAMPIGVFALVGATGIGWIAPLSVAEVRSLATAVTGTSSWSAQLVFLVVIVAALGAVVADVRARRPDRPGRWVSLSGAWLVVPFAATIVVSAFYPLLLARYLIVALPGLVLVLAIGLTTLTGHRRILLALGVAALVALSGPGYRSVWFRDGADENWRGIAQTVAARIGPRDTIIVDPSTAVYPFAYYAGQIQPLRQRPGPTWPPVRWAAPFDRALTAQSPTTVVAGLHSPQVWLVVRVPGGPTVRSSVTDSSQLATLEAQLGQRYRHEVELVPSRGRTTARLILYSGLQR